MRKSLLSLSVMLKFLECVVCGALLFLTVTYIAPILQRAEKASGQLLDCTVTVEADGVAKVKGNAACLQSQTLAIVGSIRETSKEMVKASKEMTKATPEIRAAITALSYSSVQASQEAVTTAKSINGLVSSAQGTVNEVTETVREFHGSIADLTKTASGLLSSSDATIKQAGTALSRLTTLEETFNAQLTAGDPIGKLSETLGAMRVLVEDPAIKGTLDHIDKATGSLAETAKTIDLATRGLREKVARAKFYLIKMYELIKAGIPLLGGIL